MKPLNYEEKETAGNLTTEISGTFDGSPVILQYHFEIISGLIRSLTVKG